VVDATNQTAILLPTLFHLLFSFCGYGCISISIYFIFVFFPA
jgi:hypothetical protein